MSTKNNPGAFDCYAKADPDEPMFVLLGRDKYAPTLVWLWSIFRELDQEKSEKVAEARQCAVDMLEWLANHDGQAVGLGQSVMAGVLESIRASNFAAKTARNAPSTIDSVRAFSTTTEFDPNAP